MVSGSRQTEKSVWTCPVCGSPADKFLDVYDDRYGYPGTYPLCSCARCGHMFLTASFPSEETIRMYTEYYPRSHRELDDYRAAKPARGFRSWLNGERCAAYTWVPEKVKILDIGCGFGETLGYHKARGCDVYGVEADKNIQRVADRHGFRVHVGTFDPNVYEPDSFDYVTLDQVIEHVSDPVATLMGVARILKKKGITVISTPNAAGWGARLFGRRWINWHAPYHQQFFSPESLKSAARSAGLAIESVKTVTSSEWLFYQWIHVVTRPDQGIPSAFWSPGVMRTWRFKLILGFLFVMHQTRINHALTRLFDFLGVGDNYLFILRKE